MIEFFQEESILNLEDTMQVITLKEIKKRCNCKDALKREAKIELFVKSKENYSPGRKKPRCSAKQKILDNFKRKI